MKIIRDDQKLKEGLNDSYLCFPVIFSRPEYYIISIFSTTNLRFVLFRFNDYGRIYADKPFMHH
jgi:hypothetical protein